MSNSITSNLHASQFLFKRVNLEPWMWVCIKDINLNCYINIKGCVCWRNNYFMIYISSTVYPISFNIYLGLLVQVKWLTKVCKWSLNVHKIKLVFHLPSPLIYKLRCIHAAFSNGIVNPFVIIIYSFPPNTTAYITIPREWRNRDKSFSNLFYCSTLRDIRISLKIEHSFMTISFRLYILIV